MGLRLDVCHPAFQVALFDSGNPFRNFSAPTPEDMAKPEFRALMRVGGALDACKKRGFFEVVNEEQKAGRKPEVCVFINESKNWHTTLSALAARPTKAARELLLWSLNPQEGKMSWSLGDQKSRIHGVLPGSKNYIGLPFHVSSVLMMATSLTMDKRDLTFDASHLAMLVNTLDRFYGVDWNVTVPQTGENILGLASRLLSSSAVGLVWECLKHQDVSPVQTDLKGNSALDVLKERIQSDVALKGALGQKMAERAQVLVATWREDFLEKSLSVTNDEGGKRRLRL